MLADHGRKLDEAVDLIKSALEIDKDNPSYLDSLGWVYLKLEQLDRRAARSSGPPPRCRVCP